MSAPRPEIMIVGSGERKTLRLVARYVERVRRHCDDLGRDHGDIRKPAVPLGPVPQEADALAAGLAGYADLGLDTVVPRSSDGDPTSWTERVVAPDTGRFAEAGRPRCGPTARCDARHSIGC